MQDCLFCQIINRSVPAEIVFENDTLIAFRDIKPSAKVHILIVPKKHLESVAVMQSGDRALLGEMIYAAKAIAEKENISQTGYKLVINTGPDAGQIIAHLHLHLLGGERLKGAV